MQLRLARGRGIRNLVSRAHIGAMTEAAMNDRVDSSLRALRRILSAAETGARNLSRATGMTGPQLMVLRILRDDGEVTPKTIAQSVGIAQGTATALVDKLEQRGFAVRRRGKTDRRQVWVKATEDGLRAVEAAPDPLQTRFAERLARIEPWEQAMLVAALERVALLMGAEDDNPAPMLHMGDIAGPAAAPGTEEID
ncbi:MAG: DNA-binding MarR family transcriptional regulator [Paracoccaceae bacterium]|jgi:DNA-binding MarR family transcriptional regulator